MAHIDKTPMFCTRCSEWRKDKNATLLVGFEDVSFSSWGACSKCIAWLNDEKNAQTVKELGLEG